MREREGEGGREGKGRREREGGRERRRRRGRERFLRYDITLSTRIDLFHVTSRALHVPFIRRFGVQLPHTNT